MSFRCPNCDEYNKATKVLCCHCGYVLSFREYVVRYEKINIVLLIAFAGLLGLFIGLAVNRMIP